MKNHMNPVTLIQLARRRAPRHFLGKGVLALTCFLLVVVGRSAEKAAEPSAEITAMTYNILYDSPKWGPEQDWALRRPAMAALLRQHVPELIGFQEVRRGQLGELQAMLPEYGFIGNVPGQDPGEEFPWLMVPVFFRLDRLEVIDTGISWLTGTDAAGRPQIGWPDIGNTVRPYYAVWVKFSHKPTGKVFYYVNLHLPPFLPALRERAAVAVARLLAGLTPGFPVIVAGDFNADDEPAIKAILATGLRDARQISREPLQGPSATLVKRPKRIDHFLVNRQVEVGSFATLDEKYHGRYPSDHRPVLVKLLLP